MRPSKRKNNELREVKIEKAVLVNNPHSCLVQIGNTHVLCSATIDDNVPQFLRKTGQGWLTAEYGMLPRSSAQRIKRESAQGKQTGRTQEIQRLIGRSLRSVLDLPKLGERQIIIDCDVINADGGTRTAAITGGYIALHLAIRELLDQRIIRSSPLMAQIAAVSCGIYKGEPVVDLDYDEDSDAEMDGNFVFTSDGGIVEIQVSAEKSVCSDEQFSQMLVLAKSGVSKLFTQQNKILLNL